MGSNLQNVYWVNQKFKSSIDAAYNTDKNILDKSYELVKHIPDFSLWEYRIAYN